MELKIDEKYRILTDKHNFILQQYQEIVSKKDDEVKYDWKDIGYFGGNLVNALRFYLNDSIKENQNIEVLELIDVINNTYKTIEDHVKKENIKFIDMKVESERV